MNTLRCPNAHVIACDLDDTLVATRHHSESVRQASDDALRQLGALVLDLRKQGSWPVYFGSATGRTFVSIQELSEQRSAFGDVYQIMDFQIASVGSSIHVRRQPGADYEQLPQWPNTPSWDRPALVDRLSRRSDLALQESEAQDTHKISYLTSSKADTSTYAADLSSYVNAADLRANVIISGGGSWRFVDVLPEGVDKGVAQHQLPRLLAGSREQMSQNISVCYVAAGDSMNDEAMLAAADVAIIPANGQPDLLEWAQANVSVGSLYVASERFADGVLEGVRQHIYGNR